MPGLVCVWRLTVAPSEEEMERAYAAALRPGQPLADRESSGVGTAVPVPRLLSTAHDHGGSLLHPAGWTHVDPNPPESMQHRLRQRLKRHARARWPHVDTIAVRFRAGFAYVAAELPDGESLPLCRLRFTGVLHTWASPSTWPATTATGTTSCPADCQWGLRGSTRLHRRPLHQRSRTNHPGADRTRRPRRPARLGQDQLQALIARGQIDAAAVVSSHEIRAELCSTRTSGIRRVGRTDLRGA